MRKDLKDKQRIEINSRDAGYSMDFDFETWNYTDIAYICGRNCMINYAVDILLSNKSSYNEIKMVSNMYKIGATYKETKSKRITTITESIEDVQSTT